MTNRSLIHSIRTSCDNFIDGTLSLSDFQQAIEGNGQAIEGMSSDVYAKLHSFCNALERIEFACIAEKQYEEGCKIAKAIKQFLYDLI
jgi:hypothetical protein